MVTLRSTAADDGDARAKEAGSNDDPECFYHVPTI